MGEHYSLSLFFAATSHTHRETMRGDDAIDLLPRRETDNLTGGRHLAELTREVMDDLTETKYQLAEASRGVIGGWW